MTGACGRWYLFPLVYLRNARGRERGYRVLDREGAMAVGSVATRGRVARRSWTQTRLGSWLTTVDHKKIGLMYIYSAFVFFLVGGIEALLVRTQLAVPDNTLLSAGEYDQVFTMHATTMIFLFLMPMWTGFGNFLVPLMIGARDMAFPRLN